MFKVNYKNTRAMPVLVSLLLTLNIFHTLKTDTDSHTKTRILSKKKQNLKKGIHLHLGF